MARNIEDEFEPVMRISDVPLEDLRIVVEALADKLRYRLQKREPFHGEPEYRFIEK